MVIRRRKSAGGFTLVELLIALALSMVGLLGLLSLQMVALRGNSNSRCFTEATSLAQARLEELQVSPYPTANSTFHETSVAPNPGNTNQNFYTRDTTITVGGSSTSYKVVVSWTEDIKSTKMAHLVTMYDVRTP